MKAVVTGASSGIGEEFARQLKAKGYTVVLAARRRERLEKLKTELGDAEIFCCDLGNPSECAALFEAHKDADLLVNNAGFGVFGEFADADLDRELAMLDVNVRALHILTKLYLKEFVKHDNGTILNVASTAAFFPGPVFSSYYASKAYVYRLSEAIFEELKHKKSNVKISVLCPGPVRTEFNDVAGVKFGIGSVSAEYAARIALENLGKRVIVPGFGIKCTRVLSKFVPDRISAKITYRLQKAKETKQTDNR